MKEITALKSIAFVSLIGVLFSGYLSSNDLFGSICKFGCSKIGGIPTCVYGFVMFALIFTLALSSIIKKK
jgi:hypothetical protein